MTEESKSKTRRIQLTSLSTPGQVAYDAYFNSSGGRSLISGAPLPMWFDQAFPIMQAWEVAARAVIDEYETRLQESRQE